MNRDVEIALAVAMGVVLGVTLVWLFVRFNMCFRKYGAAAQANKAHDLQHNLSPEAVRLNGGPGQNPPVAVEIVSPPPAVFGGAPAPSNAATLTSPSHPSAVQSPHAVPSPPAQPKAAQLPVVSSPPPAAPASPASAPPCPNPSPTSSVPDSARTIMKALRQPTAYPDSGSLPLVPQEDSLTHSRTSPARAGNRPHPSMDLKPNQPLQSVREHSELVCPDSATPFAFMPPSQSDRTAGARPQATRAGSVIADASTLAMMHSPVQSMAAVSDACTPSERDREGGSRPAGASSPSAAGSTSNAGAASPVNVPVASERQPSITKPAGVMHEPPTVPSLNLSALRAARARKAAAEVRQPSWDGSSFFGTTTASLSTILSAQHTERLAAVEAAAAVQSAAQVGGNGDVAGTGVPDAGVEAPASSLPTEPEASAYKPVGDTVSTTAILAGDETTAAAAAAAPVSVGALAQGDASLPPGAVVKGRDALLDRLARTPQDAAASHAGAVPSSYTPVGDTVSMTAILHPHGSDHSKPAAVQNPCGPEASAYEPVGDTVSMTAFLAGDSNSIQAASKSPARNASAQQQSGNRGVPEASAYEPVGDTVSMTAFLNEDSKPIQSPGRSRPHAAPGRQRSANPIGPEASAYEPVGDTVSMTAFLNGEARPIHSAAKSSTHSAVSSQQHSVNLFPAAHEASAFEPAGNTASMTAFITNEREALNPHTSSPGPHAGQRFPVVDASKDSTMFESQHQSADGYTSTYDPKGAGPWGLGSRSASTASADVTNPLGAETTAQDSEGGTELTLGGDMQVGAPSATSLRRLPIRGISKGSVGVPTARSGASKPLTTDRTEMWSLSEGVESPGDGGISSGSIGNTYTPGSRVLAHSTTAATSLFTDSGHSGWNLSGKGGSTDWTLKQDEGGTAAFENATRKHRLRAMYGMRGGTKGSQHT